MEKFFRSLPHFCQAALLVLVLAVLAAFLTSFIELIQIVKEDPKRKPK